MPPGSREPTSACFALALGFLGPLTYAKCLFVLDGFLLYGVKGALMIEVVLGWGVFLWYLCVNMLVRFIPGCAVIICVNAFYAFGLIFNPFLGIQGFVEAWWVCAGNSCVSSLQAFVTSISLVASVC